MIGPKYWTERDKEEYELQSIIDKIDDSMSANHGGHFYEKATVKLQLPLIIRNSIAKAYLKEGWKYVYHITSTELGEDLYNSTAFIFSMYDVRSFSDDNRYYKAIIPDGTFVVLKDNQDFSKEVF